MSIRDELRKAQRRLANTAAGKFVRSIHDFLQGNGSQAQVNQRLRDYRNEQVRDQLRQLEQSDESPRNQSDARFAKELKNLGPIGDVMLRMIHGNVSKTLDQRYYDIAKELIEASGGVVIDDKTSIADIRRAVERLQLEERRELEQLQEAAQQKRIPDLAPPDEQGDQGPGLSEEIFSPQSSNVYSIQFDYSTGTLYVTFKENEVNASQIDAYSGQGGRSGAGNLGKTNTGRRKNAPGARYAYFDVPPRIWERFKRDSSKGGAVWDHLRIRGSVWGHQFRYRLVGAALVKTKSGELVPYVPRKATKKGYAARSLTAAGVGRRGFINTTLPPQKGHGTKRNQTRSERRR